MLGNLLGARGLRVLAVDPAGGPSGQPRAATLDGGALRILQGLGLSAALEPFTAVQRRVSFVSAGGRRLTLLETGSGSGFNGHPALVGWHQPAGERVLMAGLTRFASVSSRWEAGVAELSAHDDGMRVGLSDGSTAHAAWVVGCDGAASRVRRLSGIGFRGSTFAQRWTVIDTVLVAGAETVDHVHFIGDPRRPAVTLPTAPGHHRWEFLDAPVTPDHHAVHAEEFLDASVTPDHQAVHAEGFLDARAAPDSLQGTIERAAAYEFHARMADRWRAGRVLLAGDAAHVMPPFGGQGLVAGMRDAENLAWKLAAVVRGRAGPRLLDSYELERRPDVLAATRIARSWGMVLQTRRARLARARDAVLFAIDPTAAGTWLRARARPQPRIRSGVVISHRSRSRRLGVGTLFPQPEVAVAGRRVLLDDVLGDGWAVLGALEAPEAAAWRALGARAPATFDDAGAEIAAWLDRHRATWVALRPDRYVFASGGPGEAARAAALARSWLEGVE